MKLRSYPGFTEDELRLSTAARKRRFSRFRRTALPCFFVTVKPIRVAERSFGATCNRKLGRLILRPRRSERKSRRLVSLSTLDAPMTIPPGTGIVAGTGTASGKKSGLGAETFPPLGPPCGEDPTPANRRFTRTEPMAAFTLQNTGLIGAFHDGNPDGEMPQGQVNERGAA